MATIIQQLKGTAAEIAAKTYAVGVLVWNETNKRWHGGDGVTAGGIAMARYDERNDGSIGYIQEVKTDTYAVVVGDSGKVLVANKATAMSFTLGAVATLGSKFVFVAKNIGAGTLSITPNGAETIDGAAGAITLPTGSSVLMKCDGTNWRTFFSNSDVTGAAIHNATEKTVLADGDELGVTDSAASWALRKVTLTNLIAAIFKTARTIANAQFASATFKLFNAAGTPRALTFNTTSLTADRVLTLPDRDVNLALVSAPFSSTPQTASLGGLVSAAHGLGARPTNFSAWLRCTVAEGGYSVGDETPAGWVASGGGYGVEAYLADSANIFGRVGNAGLASLGRKDTGVPFTASVGNWQVILRGSLL